MSTPFNLVAAALSGAIAGPQLVTFLTPNNIGGIDVQATLEEVYSDTVTVTDHPVEAGADISDHSFKRPAELILRCGWSNSSPQALVGAVSALFGTSSLSVADYISDIYSQLLSLQLTREPFSVLTSKRLYSNMLLSAVQLTVDQKTRNALMVTATIREVILVSTVSTFLPPQANQANPASTAGVANTGAQQLPSPVQPSPGGSLSPLDFSL